jgi:hypothetical protein
VPIKNEDIFTNFDMKKYQTINEKAIKGNIKSYVLEIGKAVNECMGLAIHKDDFILKMNEKGYQVKWKNNCKHITFQDKEKHRVRLANLQKTFKDNNFTKEKLEDEFRKNTRNCKKEYQWESETRLRNYAGQRVTFAGSCKELRGNEGLCNTLGNISSECRSINEKFQDIYERVPENPSDSNPGKQKMAGEHENSDGKVCDQSRDINQDDLDWLQREINDRERCLER